MQNILERHLLFTVKFCIVYVENLPIWSISFEDNDGKISYCCIYQYYYDHGEIVNCLSHIPSSQK